MIGRHETYHQPESVRTFTAHPVTGWLAATAVRKAKRRFMGFCGQRRSEKSKCRLIGTLSWRWARRDVCVNLGRTEINHNADTADSSVNRTFGKLPFLIDSRCIFCCSLNLSRPCYYMVSSPFDVKYFNDSKLTALLPYRSLSISMCFLYHNKKPRMGRKFNM